LRPHTLTAQVSTATISGAILDGTGSAVPHVKITAIETETGVTQTAQSNETGNYTFALLKPGDYSLVARAQGFKLYEWENLTLGSGDQVTIDIPLSVGRVTQIVEVTAASQLLGTGDASLGQVVPPQLVEDLPLNGRAPMSLIQYGVGVLATANPVGVRPFSNSALAAFTVGGLPNKSAEFLLDGAQNNGADNSPNYEMPADATREVTINIFESDATYGHGGGATANQISKSGTNRLHGTLSEFNQNSALNADPYFSARIPGYAQPESRRNQFGASIGGPLLPTRFFNGPFRDHDKLFFFFAYEGLYDSTAGSTYASVPTAAERTGDFSALLAQGSNRTDTECPGVTRTYNSGAIFDPASGTINPACAAQGFNIYDRTAFAGNNITSGALPLNSVALAALAYFPQPNVPGNNLGENNYLSTASTGDRYNNEFARFDWTLSPRQRLYMTARYSRLVQYSNQLFDATNPAYGDILYRQNLGATVGDVITFTPSLSADLRLNYGRFSQPTLTNGDGFDAATLGLPNLPSSRHIFPRFYFNSGSLNPLGSTAQTPGTAPFNTNDVFVDLIKTVYRQTLKFGLDFRKVQRGDFTFGNSSGLYNFDNSFTGAFGTDTYAAVGSDTAAFLLGLPTSASYDLNSHAVGNQTYLGLFLQDDWRVRPRLTLNFGLRMDDDFSPNEREDTVVNGFNTTATNPYSAPATAAYAAHPNSTLAVANFKVNGGLTFAGPGGKFSNFPSIMLSPRIGLAYRPHMFGQNTVIRAGFGIFVIPIFPFNNTINQEGFSQTTQSPVVSYAPPTANGPGTLSNPFPNGLTPASGSSTGLGTFVGQPLTFLNPSIRNAYSERWHLGFQHQCFSGWLLEAFYEGSAGRRLPINEQLNYVEPQYLTTASNPSLSASVANPFYGILPGGGNLNSSKTVALTQLLQTYPEFGAITEQNVDEGSSIFHALDVHIEHRTGYGLSILANSQWSKLLEAVTFLNAFDPRPEYRISQFDHPLHTVIAVSYELPYGRGRQFGATIPTWLDLPFGGWNIASSWFFQSGAPLTFGNLTPIAGQSLHYNPRAATEFNNPSTTCPAFNINAFANSVSTTSTALCQDGNGGTQPVNNIRTYPSQFANLRADALNDWDASILKNFNFSETAFLQFRVGAFNVNNRPVFSGPNLTATSGTFGQISSTQNASRVLQLGARIVF
jgi:hypothetical protein